MKKQPEATQKKSLWRTVMDWWQPIADKIADFNSRVLLGIVYIVAFAPIGIILRMVSDPLRIKKIEHSENSFWEEHHSDNIDVEAWRRQF